MNTRLQQFLSAENISQALFADSIGVARASVSHILAGRNKPGYEFIVAMKRRYPNLNLEWLLTGNGKMYLSAASPAAAPQVSFEDADLLFRDEPMDEVPANIQPMTEMNAPIDEPQSIDIQKKAVKVIIFYNDGTFQEIKQ